MNEVLPNHPIWERRRPQHHSLALRAHSRPDSELEYPGTVPFIRYGTFYTNVLLKFHYLDFAHFVLTTGNVFLAQYNITEYSS